MFVFIIVNKNSHELNGGLVFIEPVQVGLRKVTPALPPLSPPGELLGCQIVRWLGGQVDISRLSKVTMSQMWPGRPPVGN